MNLEVLVATMGQKDSSIADKMNIQTAAVFANQCDRWAYEESNQGKLRMLSTETRGVGVNRNLALQLAKEDILLLADDDITYYDGALQGVLDAFRQFPKADVIFFGIDMTCQGEIVDRQRCKTRRAYLWNSLRYGAARMAIRRDAVMKHRLAFSTLFGGGSLYGSGEDSIFIRDCYRAGLRAYSYDYVLGKCAADTSTWFTGYNKKYFYDIGAMVACAFPKVKHLIKWYFILKFRKKTGVPLGTIHRQINEGIRGFKTLTPYCEGEEVKEVCR